MVGAQQDIVAREREFHNARFAQEEDPRKLLDKWYWAIRHGAMRQDALVRRLAADADVLEYDCSTGWWSLDGRSAIARDLPLVEGHRHFGRRCAARQ